MDRDSILQELKSERDQLTAAIDALETRTNTTVGKPAVKRGHSGGITAAGRKRLSELMKRRWAERRKGAAKKK